VVVLSLGALLEDALVAAIALVVGIAGVALEIALGAAAIHGLRTIFWGRPPGGCSLSPCGVRCLSDPGWARMPGSHHALCRQASVVMVSTVRIIAREAAVDISGWEWFSMGELKDELDPDEGEDQHKPSGHVRGLRSSAAGLRAPDGLVLLYVNKATY
jgi:hypothetical protein